MRCQARVSTLLGYRFSYGAMSQDRRFSQCKAAAVNGKFCEYHSKQPNARVYKPANDYQPALVA